MSKLTKALTAAAGNAGAGALYVEDVFSTYLYTGTSAAGNVVTNGIDLAGEGGLVWLKSRGDAQSHGLFDTERGAGKILQSNATAAELPYTDVSSFNSDGFTAGYYSGWFNNSNYAQTSWTFRKAEKFFDVVTYTGDGTSNRQIPHNINGSVGFLLIKRTDSTGNWLAWHKEVNPGYGILDLNLAFTAGSNGFVDAVTDTYFETSWLNTSGATYVAYLFASDAGGFGDDGSESIIKCGSYTGNGSTDGPTINCGFEPQWLLIKRTDNSGHWRLYDSMRGWTVGNGEQELYPNLSAIEYAVTERFSPQSTGFKVTSSDPEFNGSGENYIYIAIRRPMKTPESGTEVFNSLAYTGDGASTRDFDLGMTVDAYFQACRSSSTYDFKNLTARLTAKGLHTAGTGTEFTTNTSLDVQDGLRAIGFENTLNQSGETYIINGFKRATGFFDVVAYTGDGLDGRTVDHNLKAVPELLIVKSRSSAYTWRVLYYDGATGLRLNLNDNSAATTATGSIWGNSSTFIPPTSTQFTVSNYSNVNLNNATFIAYLFASVAGVSKVGSYTGTGSNVNVDCGFSAGARFILIKRTDSTGDWYVWDSARGIVAGNDPYLLINSTAAEVTSTDYIDPLASGFTVTSSAPAALNASGGNYIFLAIA